MWFLNNFLTSWRAAINASFAKRNKASDGTIGDLRHQAESYSEHNPDKDGSVDAWDMDVNVRGSTTPTGTAAELADIEDMKREFQSQPGAQLWIHKRQIANKDISNWKRRAYAGSNPHDKHVHWQSDSDGERKPMVGSLEEDVIVTAINNPARTNVPKSVPVWPHKASTSFGVEDAGHYEPTVYRAQSRLRERGWKITVDGRYGPKTAAVVKAFQKEKKLSADGRLGPKTWRALWATAISA